MAQEEYVEEHNEVDDSPPERDYEAEARAQGWKPPEELPEDFSGDPVDAKTFVERGEQFVGILKPRLDKLEQKLKYQEQLNQDFKAQIERERKVKEQQIQEKEKELKALRKQAIQEGDGDAFEQTEAQLQQLNEYKQQELESSKQDQGNPQNLPEWAMEWQQENPWYGTDPTLTAVAETYSAQLKQQNPYLSEREFLDKVSEYVKTEMPHKFNKGSRKSNPDVEGEGGRRGSDTGGSSSNAKTYNNLPPDAKKECNRLLKEGVVKSKEQYADAYWAQ